MLAELSPDRVGSLTASRAAAALGLSPYRTRDDLMREMVREAMGLPSEFTGNSMTEWGQEHEADAIIAYERMEGVLVHSAQVYMRHPEYPMFGATPDGLVGTDGVVECKCPPPWARYVHWSQKPAYEVQIRFLLECLRRKWGDLAVWQPGQFAVSRVEYDPDWWPSVLPALLEFHEEFRAVLADEDRAAPYLESLEFTPSEEWVYASQEWLDADAEVAAAQARKDRARQRLIELSGDRRKSRACGVQVIRSKRTGAVDFAAAAKAHLSDDALEQFRREETEVITVRKAAE